MKRDYDSTVARIAGNIVSGYGRKLVWSPESDFEDARRAVSLARAIVAETKRTEPAND